MTWHSKITNMLLRLKSVCDTTTTWPFTQRHSGKDDGHAPQRRLHRTTRQIPRGAEDSRSQRRVVIQSIPWTGHLRQRSAHLQQPAHAATSTNTTSKYGRGQTPRTCAAVSSEANLVVVIIVLRLLAWVARLALVVFLSINYLEKSPTCCTYHVRDSLHSVSCRCFCRQLVLSVSSQQRV